MNDALAGRLHAPFWFFEAASSLLTPLPLLSSCFCLVLNRAISVRWCWQSRTRRKRNDGCVGKYGDIKSAYLMIYNICVLGLGFRQSFCSLCPTTMVSQLLVDTLADPTRALIELFD